MGVNFFKFSPQACGAFMRTAQLLLNDLNDRTLLYPSPIWCRFQKNSACVDFCDSFLYEKGFHVQLSLKIHDFQYFLGIFFLSSRGVSHTAVHHVGVQPTWSLGRQTREIGVKCGTLRSPRAALTETIGILTFNRGIYYNGWLYIYPAREPENQRTRIPERQSTREA